MFTTPLNQLADVLKSYHVLRANQHLAEQIPSDLGHKLNSCQVNKLITLQPTGEILGKCGVDNVHMTLDDLKAEELLLAQRRQVASGDGRGTFEGTRG